MSGLVEGRVVVVTGAGQGLGRAHAVALGEAGAHVVVNDVGEAAAEVAEAIVAAGGSALACPAEVSSWADSERLVGTAVERFGGLDALVNTTGVVGDRMLVSMDEAEWDDVLRIDLRATSRRCATPPPTGASGP